MTLLRDAIRPILQRPLSSALVVVSLALGAAGATALFTAFDGLALRPLPGRDPQRLVSLGTVSEPASWWSGPVWEQLKGAEAFERVGAWGRTRVEVEAAGASAPVEALWVSGDLFGVLGLDPAIGRLTTPADDSRGGGSAGAVAVISDRFWRTRFAAARDVVGRSIAVEHVPMTIVGVTPPEFEGLLVGVPFDVALPLSLEPAVAGRRSVLDDRYSPWLSILGRLGTGHTTAEATAVLRSQQAAVRAATLPDYWNAEDGVAYLAEPWVVVPAPRGSTELADRTLAPLTAVLCVSVLVHLMACLNVGCLLGVRAAERRRDWSLRLVLGARPSHLVQAVLLENALLGLTGVAGGALLARPIARLLVGQLSTQSYTLLVDRPIDAAILAFVSAVGLATVLLAGGVPLVRLLKARAGDTLARAGTTTTARPGGAGLVAIQVALALALVVIASLFLRSLGALQAIPLGFEPRPVLVARLDTGREAMEPEARRALFARVLQAVADAPGVERAALSVAMPVSGRLFMARVTPTEGSAATPVHLNRVGPGWFEVVGTRLLAGRDLDAADPAARVAVVNQAFASRVLRSPAALGLTFRLLEGPDSRPGPPVRVVGISEDSIYRSIRSEAPPTVYLPFDATVSDQIPETVELSLKTRAALPTAQQVRGLETALRDLSPALSVSVRALEAQVRATFNRERLAGTLGAFFAVFALLLASLGLYGVTAHGVSLRWREIGVRVALGAPRGSVARLFLGRTARPVLAGLAAGAALGVWAGQLVASQLYHVEAMDPVVFGQAAGLLLAVALVAAWFPVRRAARCDPMQVLRES